MEYLSAELGCLAHSENSRITIWQHFFAQEVSASEESELIESIEIVSLIEDDG